MKFPAEKKGELATQAKAIFELFVKTHDAAASMDSKDNGWMATYKPDDVKKAFDECLKDIAGCFEDLKWPKEDAPKADDKKEDDKEKDPKDENAEKADEQ